MLIDSYDTFDEAWWNINERMFVKPDSKDSIQDFCKGVRTVSNNNSFSVFSPTCELDMGRLTAFTRYKWPHLLRTYMDWEQFNWLTETAKKKMSQRGALIVLGYTFKASKKSNGSCLVGMTLTIDRDRQENRVTILVRVSEASRRMAVDFIMFSKMFEQIFGHVWDWDFQCTIHSEMMYHTALLSPILHVPFDFVELGLDIPDEDLGKEKGYRGNVQRGYKRYCRGINYNFAQANRISALVIKDNEGIERESIPASSLILAPKGLR